MCSICIKVIHIAYNYTFYISVHHLCVCVAKIDTDPLHSNTYNDLKSLSVGGLIQVRT